VSSGLPHPRKAHVVTSEQKFLPALLLFCLFLLFLLFRLISRVGLVMVAKKKSISIPGIELRSSSSLPNQYYSFKTQTYSVNVEFIACFSISSLQFLLSFHRTAFNHAVLHFPTATKYVFNWEHLVSSPPQRFKSDSSGIRAQTCVSPSTKVLRSYHISQQLRDLHSIEYHLAHLYRCLGCYNLSMDVLAETTNIFSFLLK
jgi:hypothetical protein